MKPEALESWEPLLEAFHRRFSDLFHRSEPREQAKKYVRALLLPMERHNGWQMAQAVGDPLPDRMQRLLNRSGWDADAARDRLQQWVMEMFGQEDGIGILDESGIAKKGRHSAGVAPQYCGSVGKIENCQMGVFLTYTSGKGHVFLDRRLYLPQNWCEDAARRQKAKVPEAVTFQTKAQLGEAMLQHALDQGVRIRYLLGDEAYGDTPSLRAMAEKAGCIYVLAVSSFSPVWTQWPQPDENNPVTHRREKGLAPAETVKEVVERLPASSWQRISVGDGEKGARMYDFARLRVVDKRGKGPGSWNWLLARRSVSQPKEISYYLSNTDESDESDETMPLDRLASLAATRYTVEQCFEEAKGEAGLDQYEVRRYDGWLRHVTLSMMAHALVAWLRTMEPSKDSKEEMTRQGPPDEGAAPTDPTLKGGVGSGRNLKNLHP